MKTHLPLLKTAMTPFPYSVDVAATLDEARAVLASHDFHHLPVTRDGQVTSIVHAEDAAGA
ncbi:MAG: CBS domain-containing protein, partial [Gammaproteobacteria bacterium]